MTSQLEVAMDATTFLPETEIVENPPNLSGQHFRITVVYFEDYLEFEEQEVDNFEASGYTISILEELASRANFTYELLPPSGFGSKCKNRLDSTGLKTIQEIKKHNDSYNPRNYVQHKCGESDVNDRPLSAYSTDMYWGRFYVTPERLMVNDFTIPFSPPEHLTLGMIGTATEILSIPHLEEVNQHLNYKVCAMSNAAYTKRLEKASFDLNIEEKTFTSGPLAPQVHSFISKGYCDLFIMPHNGMMRIVKDLKQNHLCNANERPIGIIGDPLDFGLNSYAFGVRKGLNKTVLEALNYWLMALMACFPGDQNGDCPSGNGSLSRMFQDHNLTNIHGECGYVQFPPSPHPKKFPAWIILLIVLAALAVFCFVAAIFHVYQLKMQEKKIKRRFIQQLARNIGARENARDFPATKLAEVFNYIGGKDGLISKDDLAKWMNDLRLDFISEGDFDRLWEIMDINKSGEVDPIEFIYFLAECGPQFKEVFNDYKSMPKTERQKLNIRRLTFIKDVSEGEVLKRERRFNKLFKR